MSTGAPPAKKRSILETTLLLLPAQIVFRAGEALLPLLLAMWFGRSDATDVYYFSWAIFAFAGSLVFSAYQDSAVVPILVETKYKEPELLPALRGSLLAHTWAIGGALSAVIGAGALAYFRARFQGDSFTIAAQMVLPFCLYLVALSTKFFFAALLNADHRYFAFPIASAASVVVQVSIIYSGKSAFGVPVVPAAAFAGELVASALLAYMAIVAADMRVHLTFARPEPAKRFARLIAAEVGGGAVTRVNPVVDQLMAGLAGVVGGGTLLRYSGDVSSLPTSLLQAALLPVLLSHLADDFAGGDLARIRSTVKRALASVIALLVAASVVLYAVRLPLLRLVFLHGKMDAAGVERMASIFPYHLVGLAPFGALLVLARAHVAVKNSGIMVSMGLLNAGANAVFNVVLMKAIGLEGIALSTSCVQAVVAVVFWFRLDRRLSALGRERGAGA